MAEVDPKDDSISRWALHHYRFDPERRQCRNVVIAAYDNEADFDEALETYRQRIRAPRSTAVPATTLRMSAVCSGLRATTRSRHDGEP